MAADGSVIIDTQLDTSGFQKGMGSIKQQAEKVNDSIKNIGNTAKKIGTIVAGAFAVKALVSFGKEALELGSNLAEVQNVVDVTFTTMSDKVDEFAKNAISSYGLSETMSKQFVGTFGSMAKAFGFTEKEALDMSTTLTGLAGDVASFYNIDQEAAYTKLKSVFSGETESLKDLGVVMTQSALDSYAMANGFGKTTSAMTEQEKVALRYRFVMDQLSAASGDFMRTSDGWANQVRVMKLQIDSLKATIGQGLINLFTPIVKVINVVLGKLATLANAFKSLTELITGKKSSGATGAAQAGLGTDDMTALSEQANAAADSTAAAADATNDLAAAQNNNADATKNARKEQDKFLAGFDQITKIADNRDDDASSYAPSSGGAGSGKKGGGTSPSMANISPIDYGTVAKGESELEKTGGLLDKLIEKAKKLAKIFQKGFFSGLGDFKPKLENIKKNVDSIGKSLREIFTDPRVTNAADNYARQVSFSLGQITGSAASIGLTLAQLLTGGIAKYLEQSKDRIKEHIVTMFDVKSEIWRIVGDFSEAFAEIFSVFGGENAQGLLGDVLSIVTEVKSLVAEMGAKFTRDMLDILTRPFIENKDAIGQALEGTLGAIRTAFDGVLEFVERISDAWRKLYDEHLHPLFESIASGISSIVGTLTQGYNEWVLPVIQGLAEKFKALMEGPFGQAIENILTIVGHIVDAVKFLWTSLVQPFLEFLASVAMGTLGVIIEVVGTFLLGAIEAVSNFINTYFMPAWEALKAFFEEHIAPIISAIGDKFRELKEQFMEKVSEFLNGGFTDAWNAIKDLWETWVVPILESLKSAFQALYEEILVPLGTFISETLHAAWDKLQAFWTDTLMPALSSLHEAFKKFKDAVLAPLAKVVRETLYAAWKKIVDFFNGGVREKLQALKDSFVAFKDEILTPLAKLVGEKLMKAWEKLKTYWETDLSPKLQALHDAFKTFKDNVLDPLATLVSDVLYAAWEKISGFFSGDLSDNTSSIAGLFKYMFEDVLSPLAEFVSGGLSLAFDALTTTLSGLITFITNVFAGDWDAAWGGIVQSFGSLWESVIGFVKAPINTAIGLVNDMINWINNRMNDIAEFVQIPSFEIDLPVIGEIEFGGWKLWDVAPHIGSIPYLAKGAVIPPNAPFAAVLGDQKRGTNVEAPLDTIKQAVAEVFGNNMSSRPQIIQLVLDGQVITSTVVGQINQDTRRTGQCPINL